MSALQAMAVTTAKTMTSVEIAELTGKRHNDVLRDIRNILNQLEIDAAQFCATQNYGNNNTREIFNLPKDLTITLVSGYSVVMRHRIVTRWQELEAQQAPAPRELTRMELIRIAMEAEQERLALAAQVEEMQPTVAAYDRLTSADGTFCVRDTAKQLNIKPSKLTEWLSSNDWIFKHGSSSTWAAYQARIDAGLMIQKTTVIERGGETSLYSQARITAKGLATISKTIEKANRTVKQLAA